MGESDRGSVKTPALKRRERTKCVSVCAVGGGGGKAVVLLPALFQSKQREMILSLKRLAGGPGER